MIVEEPLNSEDTNDTIAAGIAVILICWVPGIVAILHLIASHKYCFYYSVKFLPHFKNLNRGEFYEMLAHLFVMIFHFKRDEFLFLDESVDVNIRKVCFLLVIKNYLIRATNFQKSSFLFITSQTGWDTQSL